MGIVFFLRLRRGGLLLPSILLLISAPSCYEIWHRESVPFCGPGYHPSLETGECVDAMGLPQPMDAQGSLEQANLKPEAWLGSFAGQCGEEDCWLAIDQTLDIGVSVALKRASGEDLVLPLQRFSGDRATGAVNNDDVRVRVELQLRGQVLYGIWRLERTDAGREAGQGSEIRFVGHRRSVPGG